MDRLGTQVDRVAVEVNRLALSNESATEHLRNLDKRIDRIEGYRDVK